VTLPIVVVSSVLLGGGSLLVFGAFLWTGSFELVHLGLTPTGVLVWDTALSLVFFIQHSGMIRRPFRRRLARVVPPHLDGAVFSIASGVALLLVVALWQRSPVEMVSITAPWRWFGRAVFGFAIVGFVVGVEALRGFDGFGLRPIRDRLRGRVREPGPLAIGGPYRWVRHPLYTGVLLMIWSCPDVTADRLLFNVVWTGWMVLGTVLEERDLVDDFGDDYLAYRAVVPMLVPWALRPRWPRGRGPRR
jgi:protein-S-isoprenylcysteine O-methyltransferase Ste14